MMKPKLLVLPHLFYPEVASTAQIYTELFHELENDFDITVLCSVPCYSGIIEDKYKNKNVFHETYGKINIIRVRTTEYDKTKKISRIKNILSYYRGCKKQIRKIGKIDVTFVCSQPPILGGLLGRYSKKKNKSKLIYNIQDFNPEQASAVMSKKYKPIFKFLKKIDTKTCKISNEIIVVGRDMESTIKDRFKNKNYTKCICINNWIDENKIYPMSTHYEIDKFKKIHNMEDSFIIMYSGNIGLYYDLVNIAKVIKKIPKDLRTPNGKKVIFAFVGAGSALNDVKSVLENEENVRFIGYQDKEFLLYSLNAPDVHWVINAKGIKGVSVPSKCYGVMAVAKPIIGVLEKGSECERIITENNCGICCEPSDYDAIEKEIYWVIENEDKLKIMGENGRKCLVDNYSKSLSIQKYREAIYSILEE